MRQPASIRDINRTQLIYLIRKQPGLTRAQLSRLSGLSRGTVSSHVTELLEAGILCEGCVCGNHGCLETVASMPAIVEAIQERMRNGEASRLGRARGDGSLAYDDVIASARDGDSLVLEEIRKASHYVGIAVANLVDLFNPPLVIIGGWLAEAGEIAVNTVRRAAQRRSFPLSFAGVQIVKSALGLDSICVGACALAVDQYIAQVGAVG